MSPQAPDRRHRSPSRPTPKAATRKHQYTRHIGFRIFRRFHFKVQPVRPQPCFFSFCFSSPPILDSLTYLSSSSSSSSHQCPHRAPCFPIHSKKAAHPPHLLDHCQTRGLDTSTDNHLDRNVDPELVLVAVNLLLDMDRRIITPSARTKGKKTSIHLSPFSHLSHTDPSLPHPPANPPPH